MKNTITPLDVAFARMMDAGLPIEEFNSDEKPDSLDLVFSLDFVFSRELSHKEKKIAKQIVTEELGDFWKFSYFKGDA